MSYPAHGRGKVAEVSKSVKAGESVSQNPLRGRNPSRRNVSTGFVSGSGKKADATYGKCYNVPEDDMRRWGSSLVEIVDSLSLIIKSETISWNELAEFAKRLDMVETEIWCYLAGLDRKVKSSKFIPLE